MNECWCGDHHGSYGYGRTSGCNDCLSQTGHYGDWKNCIYKVNKSVPSPSPTIISSQSESMMATIYESMSNSIDPSRIETFAPTQAQSTVFLNQNLCIFLKYKLLNPRKHRLHLRGKQ